MERDQFKCQDCGSGTKTLNVHHHSYRNGAAPWDYANRNFATYCEDCHKARHAEIKLLNRAVDCFSRGLTATQIGRLHKAMMYKGKALNMLVEIVNGGVK